MKPLIKFQETKLNGQTHITAINAITNRPILTTRVYDPEAEIKQIQIEQTAIIIINMIFARWENYRRSGYGLNERILRAFDNLKTNTQMLATFSDPDSQAKFIKRTLLKDLYIIAPRNEKFQAFPALIRHIEADESQNRQLDLFSVSQ